jgi:hemoglobin-like flavoprotein
MTAEQVVLVKRSWMIVSKINPEVVGDAFYSKLFFDTPELKQLFRHNQREQYHKLVAMLNKVISSLDRWEEIEEDVVKLARRHRNYGVLDSYYDKVGVALIWTLSNALGSEFDTTTEKAWVACYTALANAMIQATATESNGVAN